MKNVLKIDEWVQSKQVDYDAWKETGLLEGLSFEESIRICIIFNKFLASLIKLEESGTSTTLLIPIIIRLYKTYNYLIKDYKAVYMFVNSQLHLIKSAETSVLEAVDYEAEFIDLMCKKIKELGL